ncbi:HNH endonuclease family protein [Streptomyces koyangensis]
MIAKTLTAVAGALLMLPLAAAPAGADTAPAATLTLADAIDQIPSAPESREGYKRTSFKHWVDADGDKCNTRAEVLIAESRVTPTVEARCRVVAGEWYSYYDGVTVDTPGGLDIDHMVPLAEAWDSGASAWTAGRREAYANDLDTPISLVAVTARTNRSKADKDPSEWLPPLADAHCSYIADWVGTKLRWQLAADDAERAALTDIAEGCGRQEVEYEPAP